MFFEGPQTFRDGNAQKIKFCNNLVETPLKKLYLCDFKSNGLLDTINAFFIHKL